MAKLVDILEKIDAALGGTEGDAKNIKESLTQIVAAIGAIQEEKGEFAAGITLGKDTTDEETLSATELTAIKESVNATLGEFSGGITLGKGSADEVTITAAQLAALIDTLPTG